MKMTNGTVPTVRTWSVNCAAIMLAGLLAACGGSADTATPAPAPTSVLPVGPGAWVVMGSSTPAGGGASKGKGWAALVAAAYAPRGAQLVNIAKGGTVTYEGLSVADTRVAGRPAPDPGANIDQALAHKPVLLFVSYPTNDTVARYSVDETVNNLLAIRARALAANVPVIVLSTQPRNLSNDQLNQLRSIDQRLAATVGACVVDVHRPLAGADGRLAPNYDSGDGAHPNDAGHQVIATQIQTLIDSKQCVSTSAP